MKKPRINPAAIKLLTQFFSTHKKGLPEWMKNSREAYLRAGVEKREDRRVIIHYRPSTKKEQEILECIDFVGVSGQVINDKYIEWANPEAVGGLKFGEAEGGQGNGGKAYLREMFENGYFVSISNGKLSVVSFVDPPDKYVLDFVPDQERGKDISGDIPVLKGIREYAQSWLEAVGLPQAHGITIVRGVGPKKAVDPDRLLNEIQHVAQASLSIEACVVDFYVDGKFRRELKVVR